MITVTWTFKKTYTEEEFQKTFSESNEVNREGYFVIADDWNKVDSVDDMNLEYTINHV